jgi:hypothetical protein
MTYPTQTIMTLCSEDVCKLDKTKIEFYQCTEHCHNRKIASVTSAFQSAVTAAKTMNVVDLLMCNHVCNRPDELAVLEGERLEEVVSRRLTEFCHPLEWCRDFWLMTRV